VIDFYDTLFTYCIQYKCIVINNYICYYGYITNFRDIFIESFIKRRSAWKIHSANKTTLSMSVNPTIFWSRSNDRSLRCHHTTGAIVFTKESENIHIHIYIYIYNVAAAPRTGVKPILTALLLFFHFIHFVDQPQ